MISISNRVAALAVVSCLVVAGCEAQVDPSYHGEPLATVEGAIASESAPPDGDAVLLWANPSGSPDVVVGETVPVTGSFPASFTIPLYAPPPDAAMMSSGPETGSRVAVGLVAMAARGADMARLGSDGDGLLGLCGTHVIAYIDGEIPPGSGWEAVFAELPSPGFHLMEVVHKTEAEMAAVDGCIQENEDLLTVCAEECESAADQTSFELCYADCTAQHPARPCGNKRDTFREAPDGFDTIVTVTLPPTQGIDWF